MKSIDDSAAATFTKHLNRGQYRQAMNTLEKKVPRDKAIEVLTTALTSVEESRREGLLLSLGFTPMNDGDVYHLAGL
jgi:hypothetical protein